MGSHIGKYSFSTYAWQLILIYAFHLAEGTHPRIYIHAHAQAHAYKHAPSPPIPTLATNSICKPIYFQAFIIFLKQKK